MIIVNYTPSSAILSYFAIFVKSYYTRGMENDFLRKYTTKNLGSEEVLHSSGMTHAQGDEAVGAERNMGTMRFEEDQRRFAGGYYKSNVMGDARSSTQYKATTYTPPPEIPKTDRTGYTQTKRYQAASAPRASTAEMASAAAQRAQLRTQAQRMPLPPRR